MGDWPGKKCHSPFSDILKNLGYVGYCQNATARENSSISIKAIFGLSHLKTQKKILIVHSLVSHVFGGGEKATLCLIDGFSPYQAIWAAVVKQGGRFSEELKARNVPQYDLPIQGTHIGNPNPISFLLFLASNVLSSISLGKIVREHHIDLLYTTTRGAMVAASLVKLFTQVPVVSHFHDLPRKLWVYTWFASWGTNSIVAPCEYMKNRLLTEKRFGRRLANKIRVVYNGVNPQEIKLDRNPQMVRQELGLTHCFPVLVSIGRVQHAKGQDVLLSALPQILTKFPNADVLFVGDYFKDPEYYRRLQVEIKELGLQEHVHFTGFKENPYDYLAVSDLLISTSRAEVFSLVVLEAMALAKPVIATDIGGTCEQVKNEVTGFLIPLDDPQALASRVIECCADPAHLQKMGAAGHKWVETSFTSNTFVSHMHQVFLDSFE